MWCKQYEPRKSHDTKVQFRPLAYHIFHNTDTESPFCLCKRGGIENKVLKKKKFWLKVGKKILRKKFWEKNLWKKILKTFLEKKIWKKNFRKKILDKNFGKKIFITKLYSNIDKCHTIFALLAPFEKTGRRTGSNENVCSIWFKIGSIARSHWTPGMRRFERSREKRYITACELSVTRYYMSGICFIGGTEILVPGLPLR